MTQKLPDSVHAANVAGLAIANKPAPQKKVVVNNTPDLDKVVAAWSKAKEANDTVAMAAMLDAYAEIMEDF